MLSLADLVLIGVVISAIVAVPTLIFLMFGESLSCNHNYMNYEWPEDYEANS